MKRQKNVPMNDGSNGAGNAEAPDGAGPEASAPGGDPADAVASAAPELTEATPEEKLAAIAAERDDVKDRMLRIAAEFENFKKRSKKEQTDAVAEARERVLKEMLEVVDYLERAVQTAGNGSVDGAAVLKGVDLVLR